MSHTIWYICIAVISLGISIHTILKKRDKYKVSTYIVFYLFTSGTTWIGEYIVLGLFNSYEYRTGLFQDIWAQNLLGHLFLNATMFPAAATVMIAYSLGYGMIACTAVIFVLVEYIFLINGLYVQHWWRYYMSAINIIAFMLISREWFYKMNRERSGLTRVLTFYFIAIILIHLPTPILLLLGKLHFQLPLVNNMFGDFYRSSIISEFAHHLIMSCILVFFVCVLKKWYWKIAPFIISIIILITYAKLNILIIDNGWKLIYYLIIQQFSIAIFILLNKFTLKQI